MMRMKSIKPIAVLCLIIFIQGCATSDSARSSEATVYNERYDRMVRVVRQAIDGLSLTIEYVDDSEKNATTIYFGRTASFKGQNMQGERAIVTIEKIDAKKTRVKIENPDYHYSVPEDQREEYRRKLSDRINDILNS